MSTARATRILAAPTHASAPTPFLRLLATKHEFVRTRLEAGKVPTAPMLKSFLEALVQELMQHWRDIEDLEDPVSAYSRALKQQLGQSKDARAMLNTAALYNQVGRFFNKSARYDRRPSTCAHAGAQHVWVRVGVWWA